ncbi:glutaredoxin domain-containing protein [Mycobacterium canetti]|uniref:glutaredoxin domain-containing protein n=1 Tax=Mycobacterium canetti TaxID=78331 RepID=UPI001E381432|nr:glutaredoxin domain-containing protein [Mycobacterium canetti]
MTAAAVTVYTAGPECMACRQTQRHLERRAIAYTVVPINDDEHILAAIRYLGFRTAPVVLAATPEGEVAWDGFRPDRIDVLAVVS